MKPLILVWTVAVIGACGSKKSQPSTPENTDTSSSESSAVEPASGSGSGSAATCESEGGKCINQAAAVACGTRSHNGGCSESTATYCCIQ